MVPDFYRHSWEKTSSSRQAQLVIDYEEGSNTIKQLNFFQHRQEIL